MSLQTPLQITFRNMDTSAHVEERVRERVARLDRFHDRITGVRVVVENPHRSAGGKNPIGLTVEVEVPGKLLVARAGEPVRETRGGDALHVIVEVFDAIERQLGDYAEQRRGEVKAHGDAAPSVGRIARLYPEQGYGFVEAPGSPDLYFTRNAVGGEGYDALAVDDPVAFTPAHEEGPMGPQAHSLRKLGGEERLRS